MIGYRDLVARLIKPGDQILNEMSPAQAHLLHMAVGISGEAGEILDAVKKNCIYQKPLDLVNIIEELGDIEFFLEGLRQEIGITRQQTLAANTEKLSKRYYQLTYSNQAAQERKDKQP